MLDQKQIESEFKKKNHMKNDYSSRYLTGTNNHPKKEFVSVRTHPYTFA